MSYLKRVFAVLVVLALSALASAQDSNSGKDNYNRYILSIKASSELIENNERVYPAVNLIDGTERSWAASEDDRNPSIELKLSEYVDLFSGLDFIYIKNGYGQEKLFKKNNRVKDVKIELYAGHGDKKPTLELEAQLKDIPEIQAIPLPYKCMPEIIRITVLSVYPGSKYNDTCLSEVSLSPIVVKPFAYKPHVSTFSFNDNRLDLTLYDDFHFECNGDVDFSNFFAPGSMLGVSLIKGEWGYTSGGYLFINGYYHFHWSNPEGDVGTDERGWRTLVFSPNWDSNQLGDSE